MIDLVDDRDSGAGDRGRYIVTASGRRFYPVDPRAEEVHVLDVYHALRKIQRFCGHTRRPYSVGEHTVLVCRLAEANGEPQSVVDACAVHDAPEAYVGDVATPLKDVLDDYKQIEDRVTDAVEEAFGVSDTRSATVKKYDRMALWVEARELMPQTGDEWDAFAPLSEDVLLPLPGDGRYEAELWERLARVWNAWRSGERAAEDSTDDAAVSAAVSVLSSFGRTAGEIAARMGVTVERALTPQMGSDGAGWCGIRNGKLSVFVPAKMDLAPREDVDFFVVEQLARVVIEHGWPLQDETAYCFVYAAKNETRAKNVARLVLKNQR